MAISVGSVINSGLFGRVPLPTISPEIVDAVVGVLTEHKDELATLGELAKKVGNEVANELGRPVEKRRFLGGQLGGLAGAILTNKFPSEPLVGNDGVVERTKTTTEKTRIVDGKLITTTTSITETTTDPKEVAAKARIQASEVEAFISGLGKGEIKIGDIVIKPNEVKTVLKLLQDILRIGKTVDMVDIDELFRQILGTGKAVDMDELFGHKKASTEETHEASTT